MLVPQVHVWVRELCQNKQQVVRTLQELIHSVLAWLMQASQELPNMQGALARSQQNEYKQLDIDGLMTELQEHQQVIPLSLPLHLICQAHPISASPVKNF